MSVDRLVLGNIEIVPILDVDALMPLGDMFGRGEPPPGGIETLSPPPADGATQPRRRETHA
jgi:hypothetical protein